MNCLSSVLLLIILSLADLHAQSFNLPWQQETALPSTDIYNIAVTGNNIWVSDSNTVFYTTNSGTKWSSSSPLSPAPIGANDIIFFNGNQYAATYGQGIFESSDNGTSWTQLNTGLGSTVPLEFAIRNAELFVATDDNGVYKLNSTGTQWLAVNNGLVSGGWQLSFNSLVNTPGGLVGGATNGYVVIYNDAAASWNGYSLSGALFPGMITSDLVSAGNYLWAITNNRVYASNDGGYNWTFVDHGMRTGQFNKGLQVLNSLYVAVNANGNCYLYKRALAEPLNNPWTAVDTLKGYHCYEMNFVNNRLCLATQKGLYYLDNTELTGLRDTELSFAEQIFYPNPAHTLLHIKRSPDQKSAALMICDLQGRALISTDLKDREEQVNVSALPAGLYYAELTEGGYILRQKIIITN